MKLVIPSPVILRGGVIVPKDLSRHGSVGKEDDTRN
jgi:hypothetical protein